MMKKYLGVSKVKLSSDNETLAENKILILYILDKLYAPIDNANLYRIILSTQDMNYFYFQQFLLDLIQLNYIKGYKKDTKDVYEITDSGREALHLTIDMLPGIIKLKVDINLKNEISATKEQESVIAEFTPKSETEYTVTCKINENGKCIFELKIFCGSREEAKKIVDNWKTNAYKIYPEILNTVNKKFEE